VVAVLYGGSAEPSRVVAERLAAGFRERGFAVERRQIRDAAAFDLAPCAGAVLIAPIPLGKEEEGLLALIRTQKEFLDRMPAAFISLSVIGEGQKASGEGQSQGAQEQSGRFVADTRTTLERLFSETGWRPTRHWPVGGAITYTRYNFLVRLILKLLAGGAPPPSRDRHDWEALNAFLDDFEKEIQLAEAARRTEDGPPNSTGST
jgi:menaquinone-dependent protoporphyrinogen oxidase